MSEVDAFGIEQKISDALASLSQEARELYLPTEIHVIDRPPSPLTFLREYVTANRPVIIKNGLKDWDALSKWTNDYLENLLGKTSVTVTATPNGYADAPVGDRFVLPEERFMPFKDYLKIWERRDNFNNGGVFYIQKQNSNFTEEFNILTKDADSHLAWASEAFGSKPDAVNFWMGNSDAITSMHKDHYENLYAVVRGSKTFILHPPTDLPHIPYRKYKLARYEENDNGGFNIIDIFQEDDENSKQEFPFEGTTDEQSDTVNACESSSYECFGKKKYKRNEPNNEMISWIAIDPLNPDLIKYPEYSKCHKYVAKLEVGDLLYLPSLWFHHVTQSDRTIAVNFWYDMEYDIKYNYFKFVENVSSIVSCDNEF